MTKQTTTMTKITKILSAAFLIALLLQFALMFVPYFQYVDGMGDTKDVSMQGYVWVETKKMNTHFKGLMGKDYNMLDHFGGLVLTFACGLLALAAGTMDFVGMFTDDARPVASTIGQIFGALWAYLAITTLLTEEVLQYGNLNLWILPAGTALAIAGAVLYLARLYPWFRSKFAAKLKK